MIRDSASRAYGLVKEYGLTVFAAIGLSIGIVLYLAGIGDYANTVWAVTLVIGGAPLVLETLKKVSKGIFAADIVAMLAIIVAIVLGDMFPGVIIVLMQSSGEALEKYGFRRASSSLEALIARAPKIARRKTGKNIDEVGVAEVKVGDILVIRHGDIIPVDGTVMHGLAYVDESALTGEPVPKKKVKGDKVMSGSINSSGTFEIRTDRISEESEYAKIVELVREAQRKKPGIQRLADKYAVYFTPLTLIMAAIGFAITGKYDTILAVLVVATPCPLIIAVPIAVIAGVNRAANDGIIVKSGVAIEQIGNADILFFDKTGTVTYGAPLVERVISTGKYSPDELFYSSACVEQLSSHPLAVSLAQKAKSKFKSLEMPSKFKEYPSLGVEGTVDGHVVIVGSKKLCERVSRRKFPEKYLDMVSKANEKGSLCSFIVIDRELQGIIVLRDQIRPGVRKMFSDLRAMGVKEAHMLTGDNETNAKVIADQAGIKTYETGLLPSDKVEIVKKATSAGNNTVMVGDGINDAPALATATVGVAMGAHGSGISADAADVVLLVDDVTKISGAIRIGRRMVKIAKQSIFFGLGASIVLMGIAGLGFIPPAIGAVLQELIDITVILNALRVR